MGKIAFVFSGQGAQYTGMGKEIYQSSVKAKEAYKIFDAIRKDTSKQCFEASKEELSETVNTQPCIFSVDMACALALTEKGIRPDGVTGFSLGEIAALTFAEVLSLEDGFSLVVKRGEAMQKAAKEIEGAMVAVMKMPPEDVVVLAEEMGVYAVNFNSPNQTAVAGEKGKIKEFVKKVKERKALAVPIKVSGAFHTPYMKSATENLKNILDKMKIEVNGLDVYSNITAMAYPRNEEEIKKLIANQASSPVQWCATIENMIEDGYDQFYEVGPGNTLANLIKKINPEVEVFNVEKEDDLKNVRK